jgi:hypothetical protein
VEALLEAQNRRLFNKSLYLSYFERDFDDILNNFWFFPREFKLVFFHFSEEIRKRLGRD